MDAPSLVSSAGKQVRTEVMLLFVCKAGGRGELHASCCGNANISHESFCSIIYQLKYHPSFVLTLLIAKNRGTLAWCRAEATELGTPSELCGAQFV